MRHITSLHDVTGVTLSLILFVHRMMLCIVGNNFKEIDLWEMSILGDVYTFS